jgi:DNA polymerase alpha-associated DNA helicase A
MNTTIASYPSTSLYQSKLLSHPSVASRTLLSLPSLAPTVDDLSEEDREFLDVPVAFLDTSGCEFYERVEDDGGGGGSAEGSKMNENEGEVVRVYVEKLVGRLAFLFFFSSSLVDAFMSEYLLKADTPTTAVMLRPLQISIGIQPEDIAVLAAYQAQVGLLVGLLKGKYPELMIGTVDSLQGQEREVRSDSLASPISSWKQ